MTISSYFNFLASVCALCYLHTSTMLWGCTCESHGVREARTVAHEPLYRQMTWIQNTLFEGHFLMKKMVQWVFVALLHLWGLGVVGDHIWVVQMGAREEEAMNSAKWLKFRILWLWDIFWWKKSHNPILDVLLHLWGLRVSGNHVWVVQMGAREEEAINSLHFWAMSIGVVIFYHLHGCYMGISRCIHMIQKNGQCHAKS